MGSAQDEELSPQVQTQLANHMAAMAPAVVIGVICGLLAIAFTVINLKVARLRRVILKASPSGSCDFIHAQSCLERPQAWSMFLHLT